MLSKRRQVGGWMPFKVTLIRKTDLKCFTGNYFIGF